MKRFAVLIALVLSLAGCQSIANIFAPPPEDISAVQAAVAKQQEAVDLAFSLHQRSMKQLYDEGLKRSYEAIDQAVQDDLKAEILLQVATPLPPIPMDKIAAINKRANELRAVAKAAWDKALAAGNEPQAWRDLAAVNALLSKYMLTRMGVEAQKNDLATDVHDLVKKKEK